MTSIALTSVHHYARLSEETTAFDAVVHIDGVRVGVVKNTGNGGSSVLHPSDRSDATMDRIAAGTAFARTQEFKLDGRSYPHGDLESYLDELADAAIARMSAVRRLKRLVKTRTVIWIDGALYEIRTPCTDAVVAAVRERHGAGAKVLNRLPDSDAIDLYCAVAA